MNFWAAAVATLLFVAFIEHTYADEYVTRNLDGGAGGLYSDVESARRECSSRTRATICSGTLTGYFGEAIFRSQAFTNSDGSPGTAYYCQQQYCNAGRVTGTFTVNAFRFVQEFKQKPSIKIDKTTNLGLFAPILNPQIARASIPLVGIPFSLNYVSLYSAGFRQLYKMSVSAPADLSADGLYPSITYRIRDASNTLIREETIQRLPGMTFDYEWNGESAPGQPALGSKYIRMTASVATSSGETIFHESQRYLGAFQSVNLGLGGWIPSDYVFYDSAEKILYDGEGKGRSAVSTILPSGDLRVPSVDGNLIYDFYSSGLLHYVRNPLFGGVVSTYSYDVSGRLDEVTDAFGKTTSFQRDGSGHLTSITSPFGKITAVTTDTNGRLETVTNPSSEVFELTYWTSGLLKTLENPTGAVFSFSYDDQGQLSKAEHSGGSFKQVTENSSAADERSLFSVSAEGRRTAVLFKSDSLRASSSDLNLSASFKNDSVLLNDRGRYLSLTFGLSGRFGSQLQSIRQLEEKSPGVSKTTRFSEDVILSDPDDLFSVMSWKKTSAIGKNATTALFSSSTMKWVTTTPEGITSSVKIDSYERPIEVQTGSLTKKEFTYTGGDLTKVKVGTRETNLSYDSLTGLLSSFTDARSESYGFSYDSSERLTSITLPDLRVISYGYDSSGNVTSVTPPSRPSYGLTLNAHELTGVYTPPALSGVPVVATQYSYNLDRQLTKVERPDGQILNYSYDSTTGKLIQVQVGSYTNDFSYDPSSSQISSVIRSDNVNVFRKYTGVKLKEETLVTPGMPTTTSVYSRTYDSEGRPSSDTVTTGGTKKSASFIYDRDGKLSQAGDLSIAYNANGKVSGTTLGIVTDSYTYDDFGDVVGYQASQGGVVKYSYALTRNDVGWITQKVELLGGVTRTFVYTYDSSGRLKTVTKNGVSEATIGWNDNGSRTSFVKAGQPVPIAMTFDDQDRIASDSTYNYAYNANGEILTRTNALTSQPTSYTHDGVGRLKSVTWPGTTPSTFIYDGPGRLVQVGGAAPRKFIYDAEGRVIAGASPSTGIISKMYVYGSRKDVPDYYIDVPTGVLYRLIYDYLGSIRVIWKTTEATGLGLMEHDEFGRVIQDGIAGTIPFGFAGGLWDTSARILFLGNRPYSPLDGRWLSRSQVILPDFETNFYGESCVDPINLRLKKTIIGSSPTPSIKTPSAQGFIEKVLGENFLEGVQIQTKNTKRFNNLETL